MDGDDQNQDDQVSTPPVSDTGGDAPSEPLTDQAPPSSGDDSTPGDVPADGTDTPAQMPPPPSVPDSSPGAAPMDDDGEQNSTV